MAQLIPTLRAMQAKAVRWSSRQTKQVISEGSVRDRQANNRTRHVPPGPINARPCPGIVTYPLGPGRSAAGSVTRPGPRHPECGDHLNRQFAIGPENPVFRDAGREAAVRILRPFLDGYSSRSRHVGPRAVA